MKDWGSWDQDFNTKTAENMIQEADVHAKGYVNWDDFQRVLYAIELQTQKEIELQSTGDADKYLTDTKTRVTDIAERAAILQQKIAAFDSELTEDETRVCAGRGRRASF